MKDEEGAEKIGLFAYRLATFCAFLASVIAVYAVFCHLKNYRRPLQQRLVVRIIWMVPVYALTALISLSSRAISHYADTVRDLYEAFVVYTFFNLLINYLGGERALLSLLEKKMSTHHIWPVRLVLPPLDLSDPYTFLFIRRGVLQFIILKPILAILIFLMKETGNYHEGWIAWNSSYMSLSLTYNLSVFWAMYSLLFVYITCGTDLKPYKPLPKFVFIKAILFFSFWQGLTISFLVALGVIREKGEYTANNIAVALQDFLICLEMVPFAIGYLHAFPWDPYQQPYIGSRLPLSYAIRDAFGFKDVYIDAFHTLKGTTFKYDRITRTGFYERQEEDGETDFVMGSEKRYYSRPKRQQRRKNYGTIRGTGVVHVDHLQYNFDGDEDYFGDGMATPTEFSDIEEDDEIEHEYVVAKELLFGDYNYPVINDLIVYRNPPVIDERIEIRSETIFEEIQQRKDTKIQKASTQKAAPGQLPKYQIGSSKKFYSDHPHLGKVSVNTLITQPLKRKKMNYEKIKGFLEGAGAGCLSVTITNPMEIVKTRLQLQGEGILKAANSNVIQPKNAYGNVLRSVMLVVKNEGVRGMQKGLIPAYYYQVLLNGTRLGMYEPLRDSIQNTLNKTYGQTFRPGLIAMIGSGAISGALGAALGSPFFLIKTRMQSFTKHGVAVGHQHSYVTKGTFASLLHIYRAEGLSGLWRGSGMAMLRTSIGSSVQLPSYELTKRWLLKTGWFRHGDGVGMIEVHFISSLFASFWVVVAMNPFDVASTRMYNQKTAADGSGALYKNGIDCMVKTVQKEGFTALYKGVAAHYLRIGPHTILTFVFLEQLRSLSKMLSAK
ncbi:hypothetical protein HK098_004315 [Nowakowskiella sp. JEL0407]|nr:hypothetical protein HK098_004315 [Nowakowskiella sp. JEL0407]